MLNNRGWGLQAMMVCILVLMLCLVVISMLSNKLNDTFNREYVELENKVVEVVKKYEADNNINLEVVTIEELIDSNYLEDYSVNGSKCSGYVRKDINYKAYIKCDNYTTVGYSSDYDN